MKITEDERSGTTGDGLTTDRLVPEYRFPYLYQDKTADCACGVPTKWRVHGCAVCTSCLSDRYENSQGMKPWEEEKALKGKRAAARAAVMITQGKKCARCGNERRLNWLDSEVMDTLVCSTCRLTCALYGTQKDASTWHCALCGTTINKQNGEEIVNHFRGHYLFADNTARVNH